MSRGITSPQPSGNRDLYLSAIPNPLNGTVSEPAWKVKPGWYLLTTEDRMIPLDAQRQMAKRAGAMIVEALGSGTMVSNRPLPQGNKQTFHPMSVPWESPLPVWDSESPAHLAVGHSEMHR